MSVESLLQKYKQLEHLAKESFKPADYEERIAQFGGVSWGSGTDQEVQERIRTFALIEELENREKA